MALKQKISFLIKTSCLILFLVPLKVGAVQFTLNSYIASTSLEELLISLLNVLVIIATPIIVLFIIYAGFLYVTARGNVEQTQKATRTLTYAIIGGVLVLGAVAIAEIIANLVGDFTG